MARTKQTGRKYDKTDKQAVIAAAQSSRGFDLRIGAAENLWSDRDVVMAALVSNGANLRYFTEIQQDPEIVLVAVTSSGKALRWCSDAFKNDPATVIAAVKSNGTALRWCSRELASDPKIVRLAVEQSGAALEYASPQFKDDKKTVLTALRVGNNNATGRRAYFILSVASDRLRRDREVVETAIKHCGGAALMFVSEELRGDREIVLAAIESYPTAVEYAAPALLADREVVQKAVEKYPTCLRYASEELRGDRDFAMFALIVPDPSRHQLVLACVSEELQSDREFVLEAVEKAGFNLRYAVPALRADREVVETALKHRNTIRASTILKCASEELMGDRPLVRQAIEEDSSTLHVISKELQLDPTIVALAWETVRGDDDLWVCFERDHCRGKSTAKYILGGGGGLAEGIEATHQVRQV